MGQKKIEQRQRVEADKERGQNIAEKGERHIKEAEESKSKLEQIEIVDDDDEKAREQAVTESRAIAEGIAESEIKEPGESVSESFKETSEQSKEYGETEMQNASTATGMTAEYSTVGSELSSEFQQSGQEFQEIADDAEQSSVELKAQLDQEVAALEGEF